MFIDKVPLFALFLAAMQLNLVRAAERPKGYYQSLEIQGFEAPGDVGIRDDYVANLAADLIAEIGNTRVFVKVYRSGTIEDAPRPALRLRGRITRFRPGSQMKRYIIGPGFGKTILNAHVEFIDVETETVVLEKDVDGKVIMGMYGGNSTGVTRGLAKEVAKLAKKTF